LSREKLERLKSFLLSEGLVEGSYGETEGSFYLEGDGGNSVRITVKIPLGWQEKDDFPEELKPYRMGSYELERMMDKGNTEKKTWEGADFEMALRQYVAELMDKEPELAEINRRVSVGEDIPTLEEYQALRKRIFEEICARPQIAEWDKKLNEYYF
jgi:hypothetical protein